MTQKDTGGPAFPPFHDPKNHDSGMTLRDWFAGQASEVDVEKHREYHYDEYNTLVPRRTREQAKYAYADAMMEARK